MKKATVSLLTILVLLASIMVVPANAAAGDIIYMQDFENVTTLEEAGIELAEDFHMSYATYTIENGKLVCDNLDDTAANNGNPAGKAHDEYLMIFDDEVMDKVVAGDYTIEYTVNYIDAAPARYIGIIYNYDGYTNYDLVNLRAQGNGNNNSRRDGAWVPYEDESAEYALATKEAQQAYSYTAFGKEYNGSAVMVGTDLHIKIECSKANGPTVYVDGKKISTPVNLDPWGTSPGTALGIKTAVQMKGTIDDIVVYEGVGTSPKYPTPETEAPVVTEAPATQAPATQAPAAEAPTTQAPATTPAAPATFDIVAIVALGAAASFVGAVAAKKRSK